MALSTRDKLDVLVSVKLEQERMFTVLERLYTRDPDKRLFLAEIETAIKSYINTLGMMEPSGQNDHEASAQS